MATGQGKGGGAKKYGRNKKKCEAYEKGGTRYKNKARKARKRYGKINRDKLAAIIGRIRR